MILDWISNFSFFKSLFSFYLLSSTDLFLLCFLFFCYPNKMQISIQEVLQKRIEASQNGTLPEQLVLDRKEYNKKYSKAVEFFQKEINKEREKHDQEPLSFIAIRLKLAGIKNIEDLRWFYYQCLKYKAKKKGNTFSKCFFGALKIK